MTIYPVMDIQRFCVHDGPGIRTVVFLKGCPMHCPWCSNPESQSRKRVLLHDTKKCTGCGACQSSCPNSVIGMKMDGGRRIAVFEREKCTACGSCGSSCPAGAITYSGTAMTASVILDEVRKDADYYNLSGGGVTLSGGEALSIGSELSELLKQFKAEGYHVAVETCGQFSYDAVENCMNDVDLFLYDVKHVEKERLNTVTGGDAGVIIENLKRLVKEGRKVVVRIPVIPGFNHTIKDMEEITETVKSCGVMQMELLPYHTLGKSKYDKLGRDYALGDTPMLSMEDLKIYRKFVER